MTISKTTQQELPLSPNGIAQPSKPFKSQLLKWVGNKQKQATDIISFFPNTFGTYFEPFLGSGGVLVLGDDRQVGVVGGVDCSREARQGNQGGR